MTDLRTIEELRDAMEDAAMRKPLDEVLAEITTGVTIDLTRAHRRKLLLSINPDRDRKSEPNAERLMSKAKKVR